MYEKFYGLKEKPFRIVPNPEYLYLSSNHKQALTYLEYGLMEDVGFILLTGEIGTGKTTLIRHILNELESDIQVAVIFNTNVSPDKLLSIILHSFELSAIDNDKNKVLETFYQFLIKKYAEKKRVLLVIDEAQNLSDEALEEVRMLSNLQSDDQVLLQIMLVGQPELKDRLRQPRLSSFAQRIAVNFHLSPLTQPETKEYIAFRLKKAGGKPRIFEPEALDMICQASGGIPRSINLLCDASLVYGFGYELKTIGVPVIEQVIKDKGGLGLDITIGGVEETLRAKAVEETGPVLIERFKALETTVQKLHLQMEWQIEQLNRQSDCFKDDLVAKMQGLLTIERKRSDLLLTRYARLREKCKAMEKRITLITQKRK